MILCSPPRHFPHVPIVQRPRTWPFQGQNAGSNPAGDATPLRTNDSAALTRSFGGDPVQSKTRPEFGVRVVWIITE
jgi:hypothetical protein